MLVRKAFVFVVCFALLAGALVLFAPEVSACNTSSIYVDGERVYGPDGNNGDTTVHKTYQKTTDIERGGTVQFQFKITISPGCGSYYEVMFKTTSKPDGWKVDIIDATSGVGKAVGTNIDGVKMGSLDSAKEGFSGTVTYICNVIVTASEDAPLGTGSNVVIEVYSEDRACNDEDHIFIKLPFRVIEWHNPPEVSITSPTPGQQITEAVTVAWDASDVESDDESLLITILYSPKGQGEWRAASGGLDNVEPRSYDWNCSELIDGDYDIKIVAIDDGMPKKSASDKVTVSMDNPSRPIVEITAPSKTEQEVFMGTMDIGWTATDDEDDDNDLLIDIYYSITDGFSWEEIARDEANDGGYVWNISGMEDRSDYMIKVAATDTTGRDGYDRNSMKHIINNQDSPVVRNLYPGGGQTFNGQKNIYWIAEDPDGDTLIIDIDISADNGSKWDAFAHGLPNSGVYDWDTMTMKDGDEYKIRITASDDETSGIATSHSPFTIFNNDPPKVSITSPITGEVVAGVMTIEWTAEDQEDAQGELLVTVYTKTPDFPWMPLIADEANTNCCELDTLPIDDDIYSIKVEIEDRNGVKVEDIVENVRVYNPDRPTLDVEYPKEGETLNGVYTFEWAASDPDDETLTLSFYYSEDEGGSWLEIATGEDDNDDRYDWDTTTIEDGTYFIKVVADDGILTNESIIKDITIFNYVNFDPSVMINNPMEGGDVKGTLTIEWQALDANDGDLITIDINYRTDGGNWTEIAVGLYNSGTYDWDTTTFEDGDYNIQVEANVGAGGISSKLSGWFSIDNAEDEVPDTGKTTDPEGESNSGIIIAVVVIVILVILGAVVAFMLLRKGGERAVPVDKDSNPALAGQTQNTLPTRQHSTLPPVEGGNLDNVFNAPRPPAQPPA